MDEINSNTTAFVAHLQQKLFLSQSKTAHLAKELIERFLPIKRHLKDFEATLCSPSPLIDAAWHELLLFTKFYAALCGKQFIHHNPVTELDPINVKAERYSKTLDAYEELFGVQPDDSDVWPAVYPGLILQGHHDDKSLMMEVEKEEQQQHQQQSVLTNKASVGVESVTAATANVGSNNSNIWPAMYPGLKKGDTENKTDGKEKEEEEEKEPAPTVANEPNLVACVTITSAADVASTPSDALDSKRKANMISLSPSDGVNPKRTRKQQSNIKTPSTRRRKWMGSIDVLTATSEIFVLDVKSTDTIKAIKEKIQHEGGIRLDLQRMYFNGTQLEDDQTLNDYGISKSWTIYLQVSHTDGIKQNQAFTTNTTIFVKTGLSKVCTLEVVPSYTIEQVKTQLFCKEGIATNQQSLHYAGKRLANSCTLAAYDIQNEATLSLHWLRNNPQIQTPSTRRQSWSGKIEVQTSVCHAFRVNVKSTDTIGKIKAMTQDRLGIHPDHQCVYVMGMPLKDALTLSDYGIFKDETIYLEVTYMDDGLQQKKAFTTGVTIAVKTMTGRMFTVRAEPYDTVDRVKLLLFCREGTFMDNQRLIYEGNKRLEEGRTLSDYGIAKEATFHLFLRLRGC